MSKMKNHKHSKKDRADLEERQKNRRMENDRREELMQHNAVIHLHSEHGEGPEDEEGFTQDDRDGQHASYPRDEREDDDSRHSLQNERDEPASPISGLLAPMMEIQMQCMAFAMRGWMDWWLDMMNLYIPPARSPRPRPPEQRRRPA